jgi:hypothetical protein
LFLFTKDEPKKWLIPSEMVHIIRSPPAIRYPERKNENKEFRYYLTNNFQKFRMRMRLATESADSVASFISNNKNLIKSILIEKLK